METDNGTDTGTGPWAPVGDSFATEAGCITNLDVSGHVGVIYSREGSRRSSHWHRTDSHYLYVIDGQMNYYWRPVGSTDKPRCVVVMPGSMVFTPPNVEHWTTFPVSTGMVSISKLHRTREAHEADLVRIPWFE